MAGEEGLAPAGATQYRVGCAVPEVQAQALWQRTSSKPKAQKKKARRKRGARL
jgi:hypothetical protein